MLKKRLGGAERRRGSPYDARTTPSLSGFASTSRITVRAYLDREVRPQIFRPFFTTKPKATGTGLSLMIARKIVEEHEGRIWFETEKDTGTTFSIELPCVHSG